MSRLAAAAWLCLGLLLAGMLTTVESSGFIHDSDISSGTREHMPSRSLLRHASDGESEASDGVSEFGTGEYKFQLIGLPEARRYMCLSYHAWEHLQEIAN